MQEPPTSERTRMWVALSGGVDSAVAALAAIEAGHQVVGATMLLGVDRSVDALTAEAASAVARTLGIEHRVIDMQGVFERRVVRPFVEMYHSGRTPNPCVLCNDTVKFGALLDAATEDGARYLVTGHYARIDRVDGRPVLCRGADAAKDQSYFLYRLIGQRLEHLWFPLGGLEKSEVRRIAEMHGLAAADRSESQDVCFLGHGGVREFLERRGLEESGGDIVDEDGTILGSHDGIWRFTVGQRKGIGVGGGDPLYVLRIDGGSGRVVVGPVERGRTRTLRARDVVWDEGCTAARVHAQVRYRMPAVAGMALVEDDHLTVELESGITGVAPGQSLVCYMGDRVVGGGYLVEER